MKEYPIIQGKVLNQNIIHGVIRKIKTRQVQPTPPPIMDLCLQSNHLDIVNRYYVPSMGKYYKKNKSPKPKIFTYSGVCANENNCNHSRVGYANTRTA